MYLCQESVHSMSYPPVDFWPLHMHVANQAGLVSGRWNSPWFHMRNFSPVSEMRKSQRSWGWVLACRDTEQAWWNTKILNFAPIIASGTLKAVSVQLNGMLMMWKIQQEMQDDAIRTARIHPTFILLTGLKCSYHGKISSPLTEILGTQPAHPLIWTHLNLYKGLRGKVRFWKPDSCGSYLWKA